MTNHNDTALAGDRRAWMTSLLRGSALAGISLATAYLAGKPWLGSCPMVTPTCQSCRRLASCNLPPAQQAREPQTEKEQA